MAVNSFGSAPAAQVTARDVAIATDTLLLTDGGKVIRCTSASATTVTVPPDADVALPVGTIVSVYAYGTGGVTIAAGTGVVIRNNSTALVPYDEVSLRKDSANEWVRLG